MCIRDRLRLTFEKGELKAVNDEKFDDPIKAIQKVEEIGAPYGCLLYTSLPDRRRLAKRNNLFAFISLCRFSESVLAKDSQKEYSLF